MIQWEQEISRPTKRARQQDITPTAVKPAAIAQTTMVSTTTETLGPFSLLNNSSLSILSVIDNVANPLFRLGAVPFQITFFQTALSTGNIIGRGVAGTYIVNIMAMAEFSPVATPGEIGGTDGNNLVYVSELINKSGSTQTVYAITNTRVLTPIGGAGNG